MHQHPETIFANPCHLMLTYWYYFVWNNTGWHRHMWRMVSYHFRWNGRGRCAPSWSVTGSALHCCWAAVTVVLFGMQFLKEEIEPIIFEIPKQLFQKSYLQDMGLGFGVWNFKLSLDLYILQPVGQAWINCCAWKHVI